jgi:hypothetical protein
VAARSAINLNFQRPEIRAEFDKARSALKASLLEGGPEDAAVQLLELSAALDTGVARMKRELLGSPLSWNENNTVIIAWIHEQHANMTAMGTRIADAMRRAKPDAPLLTSILALTLFHWGETIKWIAARERRTYTALHDIMKFAMSTNRNREPFIWVADGRGRTVTLEALYLRALLLDRFASGNLSRQQVEVLDAWLWEWAPSLETVESYPAGASLRVDLDENAGFREGMREGAGPSLYLPLAPLEAQRRLLIKELHRGRIFPAYGSTADFRIEEHIAVIDYLARAFRPRQESDPVRAARHRESPTRIEMWVGLPEILTRGAGVKMGADTGKWRALSLADSGLSIDPKTAGQPVRRENVDLSHRWLWLSDTSDGGCGFEAQAVDATGIEVFDVVGWRRAPHGPITLGRIVRRQASATQGQVFLGVEVMTENGLPFALSRTDAMDRSSADTFLFVPGDDASGRQDAFLLPEATFLQQYSYHACIGAESYALKFNRVRCRGRGWILAAFEVVQSTAVVEKLGGNEGALTDMVFEDPWGTEVSPRLQL